MKILLALNAGLFVLSAMVLVAVAGPLNTETVTAQGAIEAVTDDEEDATTAENNEESADVEERSSVVYEYTAQSGDSYTLMARKATQTYGLKAEVNLSPAQIIFVETNLTQEAGSPLLDLGEEVQIVEADVIDWVEKAQDLSDSEEAAWAEYVSSVDFNTDNVGE